MLDPNLKTAMSHFPPCVESTSDGTRNDVIDMWMGGLKHVSRKHRNMVMRRWITELNELEHSSQPPRPTARIPQFIIYRLLS